MTPGILLFAALTVPARALDGNDALVLELVGGARVEGWFYSCADGVLTVSGANMLQRVPLVSIVAVERDGAPLLMETFRAEAAEKQRQLDAFRQDPPPHPREGVVMGAAVLWAGAAPASVGDWKKAAAYSLVETVQVALVDGDCVPRLCVASAACREDSV